MVGHKLLYWPQVLCLVAAAVCANAAVWRALLFPESANEQTSNAWLAVAVSVYLTFSVRHHLRFITRGNAVGAMSLLVGGVGSLVGFHWDITMAEQMGAVLLAWGALSCFATSGSLTRLVPGGVALLFAVGIPGTIGSFVTVPLASANARLVGLLLAGCGHPNEVLGSLVTSGDLQIHVVDACDGMSLFWAVLLLSYAQLVIKRAEVQTFVVVLSLAPFLALMLNTARVLFASLMFAQVPQSAADWVHDVSGWTMMACAWLLPKILINHLESRRGRSPEPTSRSMHGEVFRDADASRDYGMPAGFTPITPRFLAIAIFVSMIGSGRLAAVQPRPLVDAATVAATIFNALPFRIDEFVGIEQAVSERQLTVLRPDAALGRRYSGHSQDRQFLLVVTLHDNADAQRGHSIENCYGSLGWRVVEQDHRKNYTEQGLLIDSTLGRLIRPRTGPDEEMFVYKASLRERDGIHTLGNAIPLVQIQLLFAEQVSPAAREEIITQVMGRVAEGYQSCLVYAAGTGQ